MKTLILSLLMIAGVNALAEETASTECRIPHGVYLDGIVEFGTVEYVSKVESGYVVQMSGNLNPENYQPILTDMEQHRSLSANTDVFRYSAFCDEDVLSIWQTDMEGILIETRKIKRLSDNFILFKRYELISNDPLGEPRLVEEKVLTRVDFGALK